MDTIFPKLDLLVWPNPRLLKIAEKVTVFDEKLAQTVIDMHIAMKFWKGVGLAASQVGIPFRIITFMDNMQPSTMVNPVILSKEGGETDKEGCLSFPSVFINLNRATSILVQYQDLEGLIHEVNYSGYTARIVTHEIDHLDGVTFNRYLPPIQRDVLNRKMKKIKKQFESRKK